MMFVGGEGGVEAGRRGPPRPSLGASHFFSSRVFRNDNFRCIQYLVTKAL